MGALEDYQAEAHRHAQFVSWLDRVGKPGHCGSGKLHSITMQIYHQPNPGDTNYHESTSFGDRDSLRDACVELWPTLRQHAIAASQRRVDAVKAAARDEYTKLFGDVAAQNGGAP